MKKFNPITRERNWEESSILRKLVQIQPHNPKNNQAYLT